MAGTGQRYFLVLAMAAILGIGSAVFAQDTPPAAGGGADGGSIRETVDNLTDILDIKPPEAIGIGQQWLVYLLYGLLGLLAVVLIRAAVRWWRKRNPVDKVQIPEEPAHIRGLRLIRELEHEADLDPKPFYFRISVIFREYVKAQFNIDALEMTTEELLPRIRELDLDSGIFWGVREFTQTADPVKFADRVAGREKMRRHLEFVRSFISETRPRAGDEAEVEVS